MGEDLCECGKESTRAAHGFRDQQIYDEYYCDECYSKRNDVKEKKEDNEETNLAIT